MSYAFRTTTKQDADTYIEDRGVPYFVRRGEAGFADVDGEFGTVLATGQTAVRSADGAGWDVQEGCPMLEDARARKLEALRRAWLKAEAEGTVTCAGGYAIDATERANRDIEGLITSLESTGTGSTTFCAADNSFRTVTVDQLKAMRLLVIGRAQALYERKWTLRAAIGQAATFEALDAVKITFEGI